MHITCPQCRTRYKFDVARFGELRRKRVKCPKCSSVFEVENPTPDAADVTNLARKPSAEDTKPRIEHEPESAELPQLAPLPKDLRFSLAVIAGSQAGSVFPITKPRVFLGRGTNMDVQVKDSEVSRRHAMIEFRGDQVTLIDLGTTNGTFVAGEKIDRSELVNQSEFTLGSTTLMLIVTQVGTSGP